ncbi:hypothetical protein AB5I39_14920 [Sphingomonas sp. MMS24-J45]|uniref:hypothetical protein n=1 Tax=Sphingomonas sp. MMS24-J45 TaxID=3238806 RepID=UPI00384E3AA9
MKIYRILPLVALTTLALAACSPKAQSQAADTANTVEADANATAAKAVSDTDAALGAAETRIDNAAEVLGNKADRVADTTSGAVKDIGNEIEE